MHEIENADSATRADSLVSAEYNLANYMWQSQVENEHYSGLAKIEINAVFVAVGLRLRESRSKPLKCVHAMTYRLPNTGLLRVAVN